MKDIKLKNSLLTAKTEELKFMTIDLLTKIEYLKKNKIIMKNKNEKLRSIFWTVKKIYSSKRTPDSN